MTQASAPNAPAAPLTADTERRLTELEIKASYADDLLDTLNAVVARQQEQIDLLLRELGHLRRQGADEGSAPARNLRDELPPHY
ncbi:MAG: SlyX family protein [Hydrogenophaga sp.]|uniref:SlyX family protein n=1 Tax=Hydrogenophaga aromaticivorans TaxID=2610898 RepID=UPI001B38DD58|nr:SlyX family protein [Hydrogenophaga aromaticivorans]MBQ0919928.1 SlyX family protein [Hydrogenophaga aromaticivorans]MDO9292289.1 SlyX family protein [Hydrogenophaga sp.]